MQVSLGIGLCLGRFDHRKALDSSAHASINSCISVFKKNLCSQESSLIMAVGQLAAVAFVAARRQTAGAAQRRYTVCSEPPLYSRCCIAAPHVPLACRRYARLHAPHRCCFLLLRAFDLAPHALLRVLPAQHTKTSASHPLSDGAAPSNRPSIPARPRHCCTVARNVLSFTDTALWKA